MIVINASSLAKYVLHEEGWDEISVFIRGKNTLYSLDHVVKEVGNALWRHYCIRLVNTGVIILEPEANYLQTAMQIALEQGVTLYDSLYVSQAQKHGELLTSDEKQANIAEKLGVKVS